MEITKKDIVLFDKKPRAVPQPPRTMKHSEAISIFAQIHRLWWRFWSFRGWL